MWGGLVAFSGPQYFYTTTARVVFACACVKAFLLPALPSLRVGLGSCKYLKIFHWSSQCDGAWWLLLTWLSCGSLRVLRHPPQTHRLAIGLNGKLAWENKIDYNFTCRLPYYILCCTDPSEIYTVDANFIQYMFTQYNSSIHVSFITLCTACLPSYYNYYRLTGTYTV